MNAERNKIYVGHVEFVSASHETLKQVQGDKRKAIKTLNENIQSFIGDMEQTIKEIEADFYKKKTKE